MHLTNFIEVCDTVKYNGVTEEALMLRLFPLSLGDGAEHWFDKSATRFYYLIGRPSTEVSDKVLPAWENCTVCVRDQYIRIVRGRELGRGMIRTQKVLFLTLFIIGFECFLCTNHSN